MQEENQKDSEIKVSQKWLMIFIIPILFLIKKLYEKMRDVLKAREKLILELRFGLDGKKPQTQNEIAEEAGVSKSYIPKVYKRLSKKFKTLYDSLDEQEYIDKKQRDIITNDIINNKDIFYISNKYNLELETICICKEIINIINIG